MEHDTGSPKTMILKQEVLAEIFDLHREWELLKAKEKSTSRH